VDLVAEVGPLRGDKDGLADLVWAIGGSEVYRALVIERDWTYERYLAAMDDLIARVGLPDGTPPR
jgi:hypothetical protein